MGDVSPKVSFVCPIYNKVAWVTDTIISLQQQTLEDIEILFIDDGSTDGTPDVIEHFMKEDKRIRLRKLGKNYGLGKAWNYGTRLAKAPIICVASGDDVWVKERAKLTLDFFRKNPKKDVFYGGFYFCDAMMQPVEHKPAIPFSAKKMFEKREDGLCPQYIGHFTMALRLKVALAVPYRENLKVGVDYPFLCDLIRAKAQFGWTNKILGYARILKSGVSISRREEVVKASE
jgi:glycosyltransferase involved in cell wall biosynthesis